MPGFRKPEYTQSFDGFADWMMAIRGLIAIHVEGEREKFAEFRSRALKTLEDIAYNIKNMKESSHDELIEYTPYIIETSNKLNTTLQRVFISIEGQGGVFIAEQISELFTELLVFIDKLIKGGMNLDGGHRRKHRKSRKTRKTRKSRSNKH